MACTFDPARVQLDRDAERLGITPPDNIRRSVAKRQAEYLAGRLCAREALRQLTGHPHVPGSRLQDRGPAWPAGCVGAITHSHGWAAAVVGRANHYLGLGLDVETLLPIDRAERLIDQILTPMEIERLSGAPAERARAITLAFSAKESLFKALYPQVERMFFFQDAELLGICNESNTFEARLLLDLSPRWHAGVRIPGHWQLQDEGRLLTLIATSI